ncbi:hypothetical protein L596_011427 [Steinernema carpocapsae]|uniref:Uncharacterized protein n=1 Tax=Steinernema carpocapsae TaxID=34508 RepID=A0A4U5NUC5_STECR|nr:hypothetical protein L596_011427 [Steinernema carpocapsae]
MLSLISLAILAIFLSLLPFGSGRFWTTVNRKLDRDRLDNPDSRITLPKPAFMVTSILERLVGIGYVTPATSISSNMNGRRWQKLGWSW